MRPRDDDPRSTRLLGRRKEGDTPILREGLLECAEKNSISASVPAFPNPDLVRCRDPGCLTHPELGSSARMIRSRPSGDDESHLEPRGPASVLPERVPGATREKPRALRIAIVQTVPG